MSVEVRTVGFCPQYWSTWRVPSSKTDVTYLVTLDGAEHMPHCECLSFKYSKDGNCKHIRLVWDHGCLWNPQWKDPGPNDYAELDITLVATGENGSGLGPCEGCGHGTVPVRIAV
jgi:hypothetical protein